MKLKQLLLSLLALLASSNAAAQERVERRSEYDAKIDGIYYRFNYGMTATVTSQYRDYSLTFFINDLGEEYIYNEELFNAYSDYSGDVLIPESVTYQGQTYPVTEIDEYAFYFCSDITSVTIPNSVTRIGLYAFTCCSGLTSITIPNSVTEIDYRYYDPNVFAGCSSLTSIVVESGNTVFDSRDNCNAIIKTASNTLITGCRNTIIPHGVTSIGNYAFSDCTSLTSITIPNSVTSIGKYAFAGCYFANENFINNSGLTDYYNWGATLCDEETNDGLLIKDNSVVKCRPWAVSVTIPNSVTSIGDAAFYGCSGLTSITIPNSVTSIGYRAFDACRSLTYVTIPNSVTSIGYRAFENCSGLTSITIPNNVKYINSEAFIGCPNLNTVTIESNAFISSDKDWGNASISSIFGNQVQTYILGNAISRIGSYTFYNCSGLTSINIPEGVTSIGSSAFYGCSGLTSIAIPESVTSIGSSAFYGCSGLTSIAIPESVTSIGSSAFDGTTWYNNQPNGLVYIGKVAYKYKGTMPDNTCIVISNGTTIIAGSAFAGYDCRGLISITIPNSVTSIGELAFHGCSSLTSITIPNSVTSIGEQAFRYCSGLTSVTIPNSVTSLGSNAFSGCTGLTSVTIGNGVTSIGYLAFYACSNLTSVKVDIETPLSIDSDTFSNRANATLYVPADSKAAYETANYWKQFKNIIGFIEGDVNSDEEIDVLDVVDIVRYVVDDPADTFVPILADINYNGEVNVGDAVALVNEIAGEQNFVKPWRAPQQNSVAGDVLTLASTDNGMSLCMENERNYTAFQFDLYLPAGTDATGMLLNAQRKQGHLLIYNKVEEGHYRVAAISTSNSTFSGYDGELLAVSLEGIASEDICLRNIRFFTTDGEEHRFDDIVMQSGTATDIASPQQPSNEEAQDIYDLQGRKMVNGKWLNGKSSKGIYIVNGKKIAF